MLVEKSGDYKNKMADVGVISVNSTVNNMELPMDTLTDVVGCDPKEETPVTIPTAVDKELEKENVEMEEKSENTAGKGLFIYYVTYFHAFSLATLFMQFMPSSQHIQGE